MRSLEKIFEFLECTDREKLICMPHQLIGEADRWWEELRKTMTEEQYQDFTWANFKEELFERYIPLSFRLKKESEFRNLRQGKMSVTEYERKFCELARYAAAHVDTDERKARRLRDGLRPEIRTALASHGKLIYKDMLHRAMEVELALPGVEESPVVTASQQGQGQKRK